MANPFVLKETDGCCGTCGSKLERLARQQESYPAAQPWFYICWVCRELLQAGRIIERQGG